MNSPFKAYTRFKFSIWSNLIVMAIFYFITACAAKMEQSTASFDFERMGEAGSYSSANEVEKRILKEYRRWKGTRHRLGGTGSRGIDCSGFVSVIYKNLFNIDLPRTTKLQVKKGKPISFEKLQAGDLVFFKPPNYPRHVGIFLSGSEFVHASKNKGVTISKIDDYYWGKYYWTARRILAASEHR
jgi:cell wall-associated NlpC family hydrolase